MKKKESCAISSFWYKFGTALDWGIHWMDINTAFLHGKQGKVYMEQLEGGKELEKEDWVSCLANIKQNKAFSYIQSWPTP